ncbi:MAG: Mth938-like domain-containing protein [Kangiella sp.]|nr:Mth938-like domain-containing protein [Kangiella sp.]
MGGEHQSQETQAFGFVRHQLDEQSAQTDRFRGQIEPRIEAAVDTLRELDIGSYEVVILGTGANQEFPSWDLLETAQMMGTPLEVMATDAACRTYTILASDGRNVLALLYP